MDDRESGADPLVDLTAGVVVRTVVRRSQPSALGVYAAPTGARFCPRIRCEMTCVIPSPRMLTP
ncbi:hypothetical protein GCM10009764_42150 [Nocardia ninae]|uniref:Uncharacterized protein n=1 Tax=Nocardia ninae NBRC 108245 TaxID=1210091 RepID=A0A511MUP5_9NOCA|nr:hypothetical protein NN4_88530 [Nocardia ninae NBRC 108245]